MKVEVKSTRFLFLYRSFLFNGVFFYTNDKDLDTVAKALNIKNKKQRIEYVYDEGVKYINKYYSNDLCRFENGQCIAQRRDGVGHTNGCCRHCPIVTDRGCPSSNLSCKLIYCKTALGNVKLLRLRDIPILKCFSITKRMILKASFYYTKEEILKDLNYGILYSSLRMLCNELKIDFSKL
ncbi:MAG: hypothetical protein IJE89_01280 [Bacilli bacterium]|nr:hypothetical protein [Bacilli bacterium]